MGYPESQFLIWLDHSKLSENEHNEEKGTTVDREIFAHKNIRPLDFRVVLFSSPRHTGSVASFLLFNVEKKIVVVGYRRTFINDEYFLIYGIVWLTLPHSVNPTKPFACTIGMTIMCM